MRRRTFIAGLGSAAAWPLAARGQQPGVPVIGYLSSRSPSAAANLVAGFRKGLSEAGYFEGQNVTIEYRWADEQYDRLPALAGDLVRRQVAVIAVDGTPTALAAKAATSTIPIVFQGGLDPVVFGLVTSLNRPGSNVTGVTSLNIELGPKRLELLHDAVPTRTIMATLVNPAYPGADAQSRELQAAARTLGLQLHVLYASTDRDFDMVFATMVQLQAGALVVSADGFFISRIEQLGALTLRHRVPAIHPLREFAEAGGLMSYGGSIVDQFRTAGAYTGRILNGEKPADLPVQQATKTELTINMKTAKALGITFPLTLLGRADEVIE